MGTHNLCVLWYQIRQNSPAEKSPREGSNAHSSLELKINLHNPTVAGGSQVEESPKASGYFKKKKKGNQSEGYEYEISLMFGSLSFYL